MSATEFTHPAEKPPRLQKWLSYRGRSLSITKAGWLFIVLSLAVGFTAINSGSNLLHIIFGCQMGIIFASGVLSEAMIQRAAVRRRLLAPAHAGSLAPLEIELRNRRNRGPMLSISIEDDPYRNSMGHSDPVFSLVVPSGDRKILQSQVTMDRRGRHRLPPVVFATAFPFGLFIKRKILDEPDEILVYPKIHSVKLPQQMRRQRGESDSEGSKARTGEFYGLAEFRSGMEKQRIHWPASARLGRPVVQEFESHTQNEELLDLQSGQTGEPNFEKHVEEVASHAVARLREGHLATGLRRGETILVPPGSGPAQERRVLDYLAITGSEENSSI